MLLIFRVFLAVFIIGFEDAVDPIVRRHFVVMVRIFDVAHGCLDFGVSEPFFHFEFVECFGLYLCPDESSDRAEIPGYVVVVFREHCFDEWCCVSIEIHS